MVIENVPDDRRGLYGSLVQLGYPLDVILSMGMFTLVSQLPEHEFLSWGWRMPFLVSAVLVGVGLFIRLRLSETPAFRQLQARHEISRTPIMEIITANRRMFFVVIGLKLPEIAYVSIATIFSITYVTTYLGLPRTVILNGILLAAAIELVTIPAFGWISDCFGRKPLFVIGCLLSIAFEFPMFWLFETRNPSIIAATVAIAVSFGQGMMFGPEATWVSELFAARLRYSGASLGFQIGAALSGGLTPLVAAALIGWSGGATWPISLYLILLAAITLPAAVAAPETAGKPLS